MRWRGHLLLLILCTTTCAVARADEIRLKDGSKIVGTIVGFDDGTFKVETAYGFALVRKANIAEIVPAEITKPAEPKQEGKSADPAPPKPAAKPAASVKPGLATKPLAQPASSGASSPATSQTPGDPGVPAVSQAAHSSRAPGQPKPDRLSATQAPPAMPQPPVAAPVAIPAAAPQPPLKPVPIQELVSGNLYTNKTYGFSMYKPPDWEVLGDARSALPGAITALGTTDHATLLVIGHDTTGNQTGAGQLDAHAAATERKLRDIYDNYRPLTRQHLNIAGVAASEQHFRGSADGHDWSVFAATLIRGNEAFTILGMTYADSDLIQFQENVINKTIGSLQFIPTP